MKLSRCGNRFALEEVSDYGDNLYEDAEVVVQGFINGSLVFFILD